MWNIVGKSPAQLDREITQALKRTASTKRWNHQAVARSLDVSEDVVRRIYAAVQIAKRQGLYGGHTADLIERGVGRKLVGSEYAVAVRAKDHLKHAPPSGYGGPTPTGKAKELPRVGYFEPKIEKASQLAARANTIVKNVLHRREQWSRGGWDEAKDRDLLRLAADDLDVAGDLYEEAGAVIQAGTLHERARLARRGDYKLLAVYD